MGLRGGLLTGMTVLAVGALTVAVPVAPARADCAQDPAQSLLQHPHVVAGTVVDTATGFARLEVSEVWRGGPVARLLWVQTATDQPSFPFSLFQGTASSADVELARGDQVVVGADDEFRTNVCQVVRADDPALAGLRPADVTRPVPDGAKGAERPVGAGKVIGWSVAALGLLALLWVGLRPRPKPRPATGPATGPSAGGPDPAAGGESG